MPSASSIKAGRAFVEVLLRDKVSTGLKRLQAKLRAFSTSVNQIGQSMVRTATVMATPFVAAELVFANFEQRMARVKALTNATEDQFAALETEARRLGRSTVFSASQAAEAMGFFALAGFKVDEILTSMEPTLNLAAAGQLEIAEAADIAAKIMAGMGIEAENVGGAIDVLTKAMTSANTDLLMLGDAMKYVGPIAKAAGIRFEEIVASIQLLSNAGIQGEMAGTTLRGMILALASPSKEAADTLAQLGVSINDANGNFRPLVAIIGQLEQALSKLGSGEKLNVLGRIFRQRQAAGAAELLTNGAAWLHQFTKQLENSAGTAQRIADIQINTVRGAFIILRSAVEGLGIALGDQLMPPVRLLIHAATSAVNIITNWIKEHRTLVMAVAGSAVVIGALGITLITTGLAIKIVSVAMSGLAIVINVVKFSFIALKVVMLALISPIGIVIAAAAALGIGLLSASGVAGKALDWLRERFGALAGGAMQAFDGIRDALAAGDVALAARVFWSALKVAWKTGIQPLVRMWQGFKYSFLSVFTQAVFGVRKAWAQLTTWFWNKMPGFMKGASEAWAKMWATWRRIVEKAKDFFADRFTEIMGLLDPDLDVEAAKRENQKQSDAIMQQIENELSADLTEIDRKSRLSPEERARELAEELARLEEDRTRSLEKLADQHIDAVERAKQDLVEARREFDAATQRAQEQREEHEREQKRPFEGPGGEPMVAGALKASAVFGTFNVAALNRIAAKSEIRKVEENTRQTARNTRDMATAMKAISQVWRFV